MGSEGNARINDGKATRANLNQLSHEIIGAAIEVHRSLGPGFLESVYEEAVCVELELRKIPFVRQLDIAVAYKGHAVGAGRIDILVDHAVVVELKAVEALAPIHQAQILSYLKSTGYQLGLLINFNVTVLRDGVKRITTLPPL
ncbi:MAG TPA: GxxExxY protein [Thermomicrobiales bacterium]|jgi:GxxExxY protein